MNGAEGCDCGLCDSPPSLKRDQQEAEAGDGAGASKSPHHRNATCTTTRSPRPRQTPYRPCQAHTAKAQTSWASWSVGQYKKQVMDKRTEIRSSNLNL